MQRLWCLVWALFRNCVLHQASSLILFKLPLTRFKSQKEQDHAGGRGQGGTIIQFLSGAYAGVISEIRVKGIFFIFYNDELDIQLV